MIDSKMQLRMALPQDPTGDDVEKEIICFHMHSKMMNECWQWTIWPVIVIFYLIDAHSFVISY